MDRNFFKQLVFAKKGKAPGFENGYIALISAIIISAVLVGLTFTAGASGFFSRFDVLNGEFKRVSLGLAESCANAALLKVGQDYNYVPAASGDSINIGPDQNCLIKSVEYSPVVDHKKKALITTFAEYRGAFSSIKVASVLQDPDYAPPVQVALTIVVQVTNNYDNTAQPGSFTVNVAASNPSQSSFSGAGAGTTVYINPGAFNITEESLDNYETSYLDSAYPYQCHGTAAAGQSYVCVITNSDQPSTFTLTALMNVTRTYEAVPYPADITFNLASFDGTVAREMNSGNPVEDLPEDSYTVSYANVPAGYTVSSWGGDCSGSGEVSWTPGDNRNKTCEINVIEDAPPAEAKAALTVVVQVANNNGGASQPSDFTVNVAAVNPSLAFFPGVAGNGTTITIDPGEFNVTQTVPANYQASFGNTDAQYLCHGAAVANGSYVCVITNNDLATTFTLTATANITRAYGIAPVPDLAITLNGNYTTYHLASGFPQSGLTAGTYTLSYAAPEGYSVSVWGENCSAAGTVSWIPGDNRNKTCTINIVENPPPFRDIDTVLMLDRTGSMFNRPSNTYINAERTAAKAFLDSYSALSVSRPQVGVGVFANDSGVSAQIAGNLTGDYGNEGIVSRTTAILYPNGQGNYDSWQNSESMIDETGAADCSDYIATGATNNRESVKISLSSVPNGATMTGVDVIAYDRGSVAAGGTYKTFVRLNGSNIDSASNLIATGTTGCNQKTQTISLSDTVKSSSTNLEIGVVKVSGNNNTVRVGAIRAVVYYKAIAATGLYLAVNNSLASSHGGTDISAAITKGSEELNSARHILGHKKYLIMLSDGEPTYPSGGGSRITQGDVNAAYVAADDAKSAKGSAGDYVTEIYTIHFGDNGNLPDGDNSRQFLAKLATGNIANGSHQPGSSYDKPTVAEENNDGDHFFVVETSADPTAAMTDIFNKIGRQILDATTPSTATKGTIHVITNVVNDNGGSLDADGFRQSITAVNPSAGNFSGQAAPGVAVLVDEGDYSVSETGVTGYLETLGPQCSGRIEVGQALTCIILNDDAPPPLPPPPPPPPPPSPEAPPRATVGQVNVVTHVINDNSGTEGATDFPVTAGGLGPFPGKEFPGIWITLSPGSYNVTEPANSEYSEIYGPQCSGTIDAGDTVTCTIINDDKSDPAPNPPLPPSPEPNISIGPWIQP